MDAAELAALHTTWIFFTCCYFLCLFLRKVALVICCWIILGWGWVGLVSSMVHHIIISPKFTYYRGLTLVVWWCVVVVPQQQERVNPDQVQHSTTILSKSASQPARKLAAGFSFSTQPASFKVRFNYSVAPHQKKYCQKDRDLVLPPLGAKQNKNKNKTRVY